MQPVKAGKDTDDDNALKLKKINTIEDYEDWMRMTIMSDYLAHPIEVSLKILLGYISI